MMKGKAHWILTILSALFIWACSSTGDDTPITDDDGVSLTFDRGAMLENWADNIILPSYNQFLVDYAAFKADFESFQNDRSGSNLIALRSSWVDAYLSWQSISPFEVGPAEDNGLRLNVNTYPTDVALIGTHISSGSYNLDLSSNRDSKGFAALDYLINGIGGSDAEILQVYTDAITGDAHVAYLGEVINDIDTRVTTVRNAWQNGYRDTFVQNDGSSATASVDRFVNDFIFYYEKFLRAGKMGIPLGVFSRTQTPTLVEAYYYPQLSNQLFLAGLSTVEDFFNGKAFGSSRTGESLASYLTTLNQTTLRNDIRNQFSSVRTAVSGLGPFRAELENNSPAADMFAAYDEVQGAVALFKVDMVSAMSIAIDFVDADGD